MMEVIDQPLKVSDLLAEDNINGVYLDAENIGWDAIRGFFNPGASKAPIKKDQLKKIASCSCILGEMKSIQRILIFLETSEVIDGFDPEHEVVQSLYGELSMYLLKLDKLLFEKYGAISTINKKQIEANTQRYLDNFYKRREKIYKLQEMLKEDHSSQTN